VNPGTRPIRVDAEVKAALDRERRPDERNYSHAIRRLLEQERVRRLADRPTN
jgi:hypothetical protein